MDFEQELRRALKREPAPPGFAQAVVDRIRNAERSSAGATAWGRRGPWQWLGAIAATLVLAIGGTQYYVHRQTAAKAERAHRDIMVALQITADKFALVKQRLDEHQK
jgi:hypothetical protein